MMRNNKQLSLLLLFGVLTIISQAQAPPGIKYQAVARDFTTGALLASQTVTVVFIIYEGAVAPINAVYQESHSVMTNQLGLFSVVVGQGSAGFGSFSNITWSTGEHHLRVDVNGSILGTSQLLTVPYAFYAETSGSGGGGADDQNLTLTGNTLSIESGNAVDLTGFLDNTDNQSLSLSGNDLTISGGNTVTLIDNINDDDADSTNELITSATLAGTDLEISDAGGTLSVDLSSLQDGVAGTAPGDMQYWDGAQWVMVPVGRLGAVLKLCDSVPTWDICHPLLMTTAASNITSSNATSGGHISYDGGDLVTVRGVCWSSGPNPTIADDISTDGAGAGSFTGNLTGLTADTTYYVRAYATNSAGTGYGNEVSFTSNPQVTDPDGNIYTSIFIGTQEWMVENLKTTKYADGAPIPLVTDSAAWRNLTTLAYCWYANDSASYAIPYGALYNWYAVNTGNLCPTGWHVASDAEWTTLITYLDNGANPNAIGIQSNIAGSKMKEAGGAHWSPPNTGATNSSGFSGLPGGYRLNDGHFNSLGDYGHWWSSTEDSSGNAWYRYLDGNDDSVLRYSYSEIAGFSLRCLRD